MIREVITYPDKRLWQKSKPVVEFDENLHTLLDDMYDTMISKDGIGLAAIQIAVPLNVLVINLFDEESQMQKKEDLFEIINPKIVSKKGETTFQEGCLSVPNFFEEVQRFKEITITYQNRFGEVITKEVDGLLAIAMQHEMDHLEGHLFIEKLSFNKRKKFEKEFKKAQKNR